MRELSSPSSAPRFGAPAAFQAAQQARPGAQLDNRGSALTPPRQNEGLQPAMRRRKAWALRDLAAHLLRPEDGRGPAVCGCGRAGHEIQEVGLHLREDGSARTSGAFRCDSGWLCPVCAPRRGKERAEKMAEVFDHVKAFRDGQMVMCTLTVRHRRGQSLADLKKVVQAASVAARQGAPWARQKEKYNVFGVISAPEVTYSFSAGWHFHIHVALLLRGSSADADDLGSWFVERYMRYVQRKGYTALVAGQDVSVIRNQKKLAEYLSKGVNRNRDLAWEMAGQATKSTRHDDGLHPFEILEKASGDNGMKALWLEYAAAMKGVRSCIVTKAIADALGIEPEDDEDKPGQEEREEDAPVGTLRAETWNTLMRRRLASSVLTLLEDGGAEAWQEVRQRAEAWAHGYDDSAPPEAVHAPSAEHVAVVALGLRHHHRHASEAVRAAVDRERGVAASLGRNFRPPALRRVLELVAA